MAGKTLMEKAPEEMTIPEIMEFMSKSSKEILEYAKKRVGIKTEPVKARYPVEYDPIRRYCHMMNDDNPLYLDLAYAKKAGFRDVVCPPLLVGYFTGPGIWPPSQQGGFGPGAIPRLGPPHAAESPRSSINMATEWEFYKPVIVGDHLSSYSRVGEPYMKAIRRDPEALWFVSERVILNQNGEEVAVMKNIGVDWKREGK